MKRLTHIALTALLGLSAIGSHAQDGGEGAPTRDGWYQIHVAVFGHNSGSGEYEEVWRKQLQLKYPRQLMRLKTLEQYVSDLCGIDENEEAGVKSDNRLVDILERVDSGAGYPEESQRALDPACREFRPDLFPPSEAEKNRAQADATIAAAQSLVSGKTETRAQDRQPPIPFVLSEQVSDPEFAEMVKKIRGAARYRLLFSGSWPQALKPRDEAPAVLIQGGDRVGQHYQLEGYVKLALERYLHIDTDLWLSQFRERRLPHDSGFIANDEPAFTSENEAVNEATREFPALPVPFPVNDRRAAPAATDTAAQPALHTDLPEGQTDNKLNVLLADDSSHTVERTVVMQQTRRMRSGEVHYLDHPLFGVLVKITPLPGEQGGAKPGR